MSEMWLPEDIYRSPCVHGGMDRLIICVFVLSFLVVLSSCEKKKDLNEKVQNLMDWRNKKSVIPMDGDKYRTYIRSEPRNYSVILLLTTRQDYKNCNICVQAHDEFKIVANSWMISSHFSNKLFLAMVYFDEGGDVFQALKLESIPAFVYFPPKGKPKRHDHMDIDWIDFSAEQIAKFVREKTNIPLKVFRPPNYSGLLALTLLVSITVGLLDLRVDTFEMLYDTTVWGLISLSVMFFIISGQMWNHIRRPPFIIRNPQTGQAQFIDGHSRGQLVFETYIVMILYLAFTVGMILLNNAHTLRGRGNVKKKRTMVIVGLVVVAVCFNLICSMFRHKHVG